MPQPIAVVTGATSGIGRHIAAGLAQANYHVVLIARDPTRAAAVQSWIHATTPHAQTEILLADLSSLTATAALARTLAARHPAIALLVANAGIFQTRRHLTPEGHDTTLAVNHLSPFVLIEGLRDALTAGAPSRIVVVGSSTSDTARIDPDNLELTRGWGMVRAYSQSKLAVMIATFGWARRLAGTGVVANVVHPGAVATSLVRSKGVIGLAWRLMAPFMRTEQQGADTPLHIALAPDWATRTGQYAKDRRAVPPNPRALDPVLAERVWQSTCALIARDVRAAAAAGARVD
jgi:NAD(P)-dependent dehydrogenase (short-subunit alcohol dehydrogenase family)